MDINFELYKIFYFAAKSENFSEAARRLFITQSAVSQGIKNLENKLGLQLFIRKSRNSKLTPEGKLLFSHIEQAYNFIKIAEQKVGELQNLEFGEIRIGASDTICKYYLLPFLQRFNQNFPKIKIRVINRTSSQILGLLHQGALDLGIVTLPVEAKNIRFHKLTEVQDVWVASPKFRTLQTRRLSLTELIAQPLLLLEKTSITRRNLDQFFAEFELVITPEIELESVDLLVEFAKIGLGIAHVMKESAAQAIVHSQLFELKTDTVLPLRQLGVATMDSVPLSRAAKQFIDSLYLPR